MTPDPLRILQDLYGYDAFRGEQAAIIDAVVAGRDVLVLMPTGGGKSLCYQVPALVRSGTGIVVSPLIALMQDQVDALVRLGIRAEFLNSTLDPERQADIRARLRSGDIDVLYVAPERLLQQATLELLQSIPVALIAVDEAHCVSQWGHDFRQDYLGLAVLADAFPGVPRMALTATADIRTRTEIVERLALSDPLTFVASFDRPNIRYRVQVKADTGRQLRQFLAAHEGEAGIVYCMSRAKTEQVAGQLEADGYTALPYHAGMPAETRRLHQQRFLREEGVIIVATIAFGMGIDKPDVRFVVHLDLPKSIESYYQETGRAGRDGEPAETLLLYGLQDVVRLRQMVDTSAGNEAHKRIERNRLDALLGWCETIDCRRRSLLACFDEHRTEACGNCDTCLEPPKTFDATVPAQMLLSTVYRTGQRFGAAHLVDVLLGKSTDKTIQHGHEALSVWGIGTDLGERQWRSVIRQLTVRGALYADADRYGAIRLAGEARELLRGESRLVLREDPHRRGGAARSRTARAASAAMPADAAPLWDALRAERRRIAEREGVPPYVIFHDATLAEMATVRPASPAALLEISGVGRSKLERYGDAFLEVIRAAEYAVALEGELDGDPEDPFGMPARG